MPNRSSYSVLIRFTVLVALAMAAPVQAQTITRVRGPYLQQPTDRSMVVVWATREAGPAEVRYATPGGSLSAPAASRQVLSTDTAFGYDYYQHEASVTGLTAATTYSYQPFVAGVAAAPQSQFRTAPAIGTGTVSFIAFGDSGTGSVAQAQLAAVMAQDTFDFALHAGDIAYAGLDGRGDASYTTYQSFLFDVYNWFPSRPFVPVEGNHDSRPSNQDGRAYLDLFALPRNGASATHPEHAERYYSFDYGPVHVVALDTEFTFQDTARRQEQLRWLEADLAATQQPWKVAIYHRSPYSSGGEHGSDLAVRAAFAPLLERYGVDLVLTAHEHDYERTVPIKESLTTTDRAVTYVVTGGGGAPLYPSGTSPWTAYSASRHQYVKVVVSGCTLTLHSIGLDGASFDNTTISHCTDSDPPPAVLPTGWANRDVGATGIAGSAAHTNGVFTIDGAGADVWGTADAFHYAYTPLSGDGTIVARVSSIQPVHAWTKAGVMIRNSLSPSAAQAFMLVASSAAKGVPYQRRVADGNTSISSSGSQSTAPRWVRLVRAGNTITGSESPDGVTWTQVGSSTFTMAADVYVGLAVSSHVAGVNAAATFDNVTITASLAPPPPPPNAAPTVALTAPAEGAAFASPATITLTASAADSDGTIAAVDFFAGASKLGTDTTAPYSFTWSNVAAGTYSLRAVAIDNAAATTTSAAVSITVSDSPTTALPSGWTNIDVGNTGAMGAASLTNGVYSVEGAGADVWGTADAFHYAYRALDGDGSIVARVTRIEAVHAWTKAGIMIRNSLSPSAAQAFMLVASSAAKGVPYQRRLTDGGSTVSSPGSQSTAPRWVKLTRVGSAITGYESADGSTWTQVGTSTFSMAPVVYVGLAVSSHVTGVNALATFDNVTITASAPPPQPPPPPPPGTTTLPEGWSNLDVGATGATGSATLTNGAYSVRGAGADVWGTADAFHYAYRALDGDGSIVARVTSIEAVHAWTKAGVMIRNSLTPSAAQAFMLVASSSAKGVPYQRRLADGSTSISTSGSQSTAPRWVKLTRVGNAIAGYESADGTTWTQVGSSTFVMGPVVYVGLAVSSHVTGVTATATFDSVVIQQQ